MLRPGRLRVRYGAGLAFAYLMTAAEVVAIVISLSAQTITDAQSLLSAQNLIATAAIVVVGTVATSVGSVLITEPAFRRRDVDRAGTPHEPRPALNITRYQSAILLAPWVVAAAVMLPLNADAGAGAALVIASAVLFGATATVCTGFLFTQRTLRPLMAMATDDFEHAESAPGVRARLILMWTVCTALPGAGIVMLIVLRRNGWLIQDDASIEIPVLVLALVAVLLGLRAMIVVSRSISDPVHDVVDAIAEVERGRIGQLVEVYERSEIGRLQSGFNRMVVGLRERDRLRDLFGRHVGPEVVRRAVAESDATAGDVRDAAILFIDLVGSTQFASSRSPQQVADVLNDFFRIVVAAVDDRDGMINKFQGDAALAVFGVPLRIGQPASAALATARTLGEQLRRLPLDYGIGVSAGRSSQATSVPRTGTSTPLSATPSTKRRDCRPRQDRRRAGVVLERGVGPCRGGRTRAVGGADGVDPNSQRSQLRGHRPRHAERSRLGRGVGGNVGVGSQPLHARDADDCRCPTGLRSTFQVRQKQLDQQRLGPQIDVDTASHDSSV